MRYTPGTLPDGGPLKVVNPNTGEHIAEPFELDHVRPEDRTALLRLIDTGDLVPYTDPPPKKTMKGDN